MDRLSHDILVMIIDLLDYVSLLDFSATCRRHKLAADPVKFRVISLSFKTAKDLQSVLRNAASVLEIARGFQYVQHIELVTKGPDSEPMLDRSFSRDLVPLEPWAAYELRPRITYEPIKYWEPLWDVLVRFTSLKHLSWALIETIPDRLIHILSRWPHCELHVYYFDLRHSGEVNLEGAEPDQHTKDIATAPYLSSLAYRGTWPPSSDGSNLETVMKIVTGNVPKLRRLYLWLMPPFRRHPTSQDYSLLQALWTKTSMKRADASLLAVDDQMFDASLPRYTTITDLNLLTTLSLTDRHIARELAWLTDGPPKLPNLKQLTVRDPEDIRKCRHCRPEALVSFIATLPCLAELNFLCRLDQKYLVPIVQACGKRLKVLSAEECPVDLNFIQILQHTCPDMERLGLLIHRWAGSVQEVKMYEALGKLRMLDTLMLQIRSFQAGSCHGDFEALWCGTRPLAEQTHFQDLDADFLYHAFRDLAFDEQLARSIFSMIVAAKPPYARPLERLELWPDLDMDDGDYLYARWFEVPPDLGEVTHFCICVRDLADPHGERCFVKTEKSAASHCNCRYSSRDLKYGGDYGNLQPELYDAVMRKVWPETSHAELSKVWHSFGLYEARDIVESTAPFQ